jgi:hypothetical protein
MQLLLGRTSPARLPPKFEMITVRLSPLRKPSRRGARSRYFVVNKQYCAAARNGAWPVHHVPPLSGGPPCSTFSTCHGGCVPGEQYRILTFRRLEGRNETVPQVLC